MLKTIKRVLSDLKENNQYPIGGIKLYLLNKNEQDDQENLLTLHCDIKIQHGIYKDITVHTILHIPEKYPYNAPAMNIATNFEFTHEHHEHVIGKSICNDMLSNFASFFKTIDSKNSKPKVASGWSSGYTINVILSQMQIFFSDPDLKQLPSDEIIKKLEKHASQFVCKECDQKRTYTDLIIKSSSNNSDSDNFEKDKTECKELEELKKKLICGITKMDLTNKHIIIGYPLLMEIDKFNRLWPQVILENISYDGYMEQIQNEGINKLDNFKKIKMYSANGNLYNYWIPFYVNEDHFQRSIIYIKNAISVIQYGMISGLPQYDFKPDMILTVLPCLMNKTIVHIMNGTIFNSTVALQAYCNFLRLYLRLIEMFNLKTKINQKVKCFMENETNRNKKNCGDLGEFIINMFLSEYSYFNNENLKYAFINEFFARQIYWIEKETKIKIEHIKEVDVKLEKCFNASKTSNFLLVFNIEIAKWFITDIENKIKLMDSRLGFIPDNIIKMFQKRVAQIKSIPDYNTFMQAIQYFHIINSPDKMSKQLDNAKKLAINQGYIR